MAVKPVPEGMHTLTPHLAVKDANAAIDFYKKAFNATECHVSRMPNGTVMHGHLRIGDSNLFLAEEFPDYGSRSPLGLGGTPVSMHMYVDDADAAWDRALKAGCTVVMPLQDQFWGDRYGLVADPFGHKWAIASHVEDLTPEQMAERGSQAFGAHT